MNPLDLAWLAGFFDGEGCITIKVDKGTLVSLRVTVVNAHRGSIDRVNDLFPGKVYSANPRGPRLPVWCWDRGGQKAAEFIEAILPYSVVKADQLSLGLEFYRLPWRRQMGAASGIRGHVKRRTDEQVAADLEMAQRMKDLKLIWRKPA